MEQRRQERFVSDQIDIPPEAFEPKPIFPDRPGKEIVKEIREWIKTEAPWMWRGHTHARPDKIEAEQIRYIAEFELPNKTEAPCPICRPMSGKFNKGFIAWFPVTGCVRLMGQDCFRKLNPEADAFAKDELDDLKKRQQDLDYVIANLPNRGKAISAIESARPVAKRLDELQDQLGDKLIKTYGIDLWRHVREDGRLRLFGRTEGFDEMDAGSTSFDLYGTAVGTTLIDPSRKDFAPGLSSALSKLESISLPKDIYSATDDELRKAARDYGRGLNIAREIIEAMEDARSFVSVQNTATLRNWAQNPGAPERFYIRRDGNSLTVGRSNEDARPIPIDPVIDRPLPELPSFVLGD
jgi:hypothetical protein